MVIDELHAGAPSELAILLNALQNLSHDRHDNPFAFLGAGIPSVGGVLTAAATFGERSRWLTLPALTKPELTDALQAPAQVLGVTWESDALDIGIQPTSRAPGRQIPSSQRPPGTSPPATRQQHQPGPRQAGSVLEPQPGQQPRTGW